MKRLTQQQIKLRVPKEHISKTMRYSGMREYSFWPSKLSSDMVRRSIPYRSLKGQLDRLHKKKISQGRNK